MAVAVGPPPSLSQSLEADAQGVPPLAHSLRRGWGRGIVGGLDTIFGMEWMSLGGSELL